MPGGSREANVDHVPEMEGDRKLVEDAISGYFNMGRLFANGYLKALLEVS